MAKSNLAKIIPIRAGLAGGDTAGMDQLEKTSKEIDAKQKERDEKLIKTNEKLVTNLDKLASAIKSGVIQPNAAPNYKEGGTWDQRTVKDQAKDYLMGRKGADGKRDKFDKDSLKYKFGSVRGLAKTLNVVEDDSFVGNLLGRREDKLKRADTLMKMNPQMKNLKQFKGDDEKVRQYYIKQHEEEFAPAAAKAQSEKYKLDSMLQSGINPDELAKSVGGKRQIKAVETAQADELLKDKFRKQEVKGVLDGMSGAVGVPSSKPSADSNVIPFPSRESSSGGFGSDKESTLENNRLMAQQNDMMSGIKENTAAFPIYLEEWREETKRKVTYDAQLLQAVQEGGGGGGGGGIMDMAGDMLGKGKGKLAGGLGKMGGMLKAGGGMLSRAAGPLAAATAIIGGGVTAYQGYNAASEKEAKGQITKEEATVEKGGAIGEGGGQAVGGAVGALKGAAVGAAVGSVIPVVGTAVGGLVGAAIGGLGGSYLGGKAGKFLGETGGKIKNWFSSSNADKSGAEAKVQSMGATPQAQTEPKVVQAAPTAQQQEEGLRAYDKAYSDARSDGKTVAEAKKIAAEARGKALGQTSAKSPAATPAAAPAVAEKSTEKAKAMTSTATPQVEAKPASQTFPLKDTGEKTASQTFPLKDNPAAGLPNLASKDNAPYDVKTMSAQQQQQRDYEAKVKPQVPKKAEKVATVSNEVQAAKEQPAASTNVNSSNVSSTKVENRNTQAIKPPIRNQDSSFYNMVEARYVY
jgi:hypothetical protein